MHRKGAGIKVESSKGEWGEGQHEVNVRYADVLEMADRHVVFKQCLKEIADAAGVSVTFMAKVAADRAGSGRCRMKVCAACSERATGPIQLRACRRDVARTQNLRQVSGLQAV